MKGHPNENGFGRRFAPIGSRGGRWTLVASFGLRCQGFGFPSEGLYLRTGVFPKTQNSAQKVRSVVKVYESGK
jgi:hypothetical protein